MMLSETYSFTVQFLAPHDRSINNKSEEDRPLLVLTWVDFLYIYGYYVQSSLDLLDNLTEYKKGLYRHSFL